MSKYYREESKMLSKALEGVDFGCRGCVGIPVDWREAKTKTNLKQRRCCVNCAESKGYLNWKLHEELKGEYKFNKIVGYWRRGKGCALPRELRSQTCQTYQCEAAKKAAPHVRGYIRITRELWQDERYSRRKNT